MLEGVFSHGPAHPARYFFGAVGHLVGRSFLAFPPFLGAIGVVAGHTHHADGGVNAGDGPHAGNAPAGAQDDLRIHLLAQDAVGAAHISLLLRGNRGGFQGQTVLPNRLAGIVDHLVLGSPPVFQA